MPSKSELKLLTQRLDGYLDALAIMNGSFEYLKRCRYFAYLVPSKTGTLEAQLPSLYEPFEAQVSFGPITAIPSWLSPLNRDLEEVLLGNLLGSPLGARDHPEKNRISQAVWYVMDMIRIITDDFSSSPEIYKCQISVTTKYAATGTLYILPLGTMHLVINLQWPTAA
jgi:hypothetical protein